MFLNVYEYDYLEKLVNQGDIEIAKKIVETFRYQDDCIALNDNGIFAQYFNLIYPPEMILKCTNISKAVKSVLSWILRISVFRGQFLY